jgi:hypothetical protein
MSRVLICEYSTKGAVVSVRPDKKIEAHYSMNYVRYRTVVSNLCISTASSRHHA